VWLGPNGGCAETPAHPIVGTFACWGSNDAGQIGDGTTTARPTATSLAFPFGKVTDLALGDKHSCGVFDEHVVACWGDGARGQLGSRLVQSSSPVKLGEGTFAGQAVGVGGAHTCVRVGNADQLSCFGADDEGQLGGGGGAFPVPSKDWSRGARIRSFALGSAHTCAAYDASGASKEHVLCRGRAAAAPGEPLLGSVVVRELAAGVEHTCALIEDGTVRCWGRNDAGQLGDGTTSDTTTPVSVVELTSAVQVAAGFRHTCALLRNGTVACWGQNDRHQLATGTTQNSSRPRLVVGIVGAKELSLAGNGACVRLEGGYARCWGANDRGQLGDGSTVEHSVPMPIRFR
jgi:alpha-tubulin suppressor-like RCC1 family protein